MMCDHCGQPILPIEASRTIPVDSANGARPNLIVHVRPCRPVPPGLRQAR